MPWKRLLAGAVGIVGLVLAMWWATQSGVADRTPPSVSLQRLTLSGTAIDAAKANSMPKDNIQRAIQRGAGGADGDARVVERKKAGLHKARKAPQFSKR